jgi:hypothetical protein
VVHVAPERLISIAAAEAELEDLRSWAGFTSESMCAHLGLTRTVYRRWERGGPPPRATAEAQLLAGFAAAVGRPVAQVRAARKRSVGNGSDFPISVGVRS